MKMFLLALAGSTSLAAGVTITNWNFDGNLGSPGSISPWTVLGSTPGLSLTRVPSTLTNPVSQPYSLRVDGRKAPNDGPAHSLGGLVSGTRYTTRFYIKLDAPAQVRCLVLMPSVSTVPFLLAETIVRADRVGQWILVQGTQTLTWTGNLTGAQMYFAVEQLYPLSINLVDAPAGSFPGYNLENVQMEVDTDGDGFFDLEEVPADKATNPSLADSDLDGMPDQWEFNHGLNPLANDAALDPDGDGYTNLQEYWACTDPQNFAEHPGMPSDSLATPQTRALLRYLHVLPSRPVAHLLDGQQASYASVNDFGVYVQGLATAMQTATGTARWPATVGLFCEQIAQNGALEVTLNGPIGRSYIDAGGLIVLSWTPYNPWNGRFVGDKTGVDIPNLLTAGTAANVRFTGWMDQIAAEIALFGPDRPVIFRPFSEMNGGWDWYGHLTQADFTALWRWLRDYFVQTKGLHNLIWAYECHTDVHQPANKDAAGYSMDYYWPGDDAVDLLGYSIYTTHWDAAFDTDAQSRLHPKAFAITEGGPPTRTDGLAPNDYNTRYVPQCAAKYPRSSFFIVFNSFPVWDQATQTSSHNYLAIVDNPNYVALMTDPAVVNRGAVYWRAPSSLAGSAGSASQIGLNWAAVAGATGYRVEVSTDGQYAWTLAGTTGTASATVGGFAPATTRYFRVRALYPDGDSDATDPLIATTFTAAQGWCATHLGNANASMLGDTDRDGLAEVVEYALGLNPLAVSAPPSRSFVNVSGVDYLAMTFTRDLGASDATLTVQWSSDLVTWHDGSSYGPGGIVTGNAFTTEVSRVPAGGQETITVRANVPMGSGRQFLRLKAGI